MNRKRIHIVMAAALATIFSIQAPAVGGAQRYVAPLDSVEAVDLSFMREEEKLARDVYLKLYEQWGLTPFSNIAASEQQHMDALLKLLRAYRLPDPAAGHAVGEFDNAALQALYQRLLEQGGLGDIDAVKVGGVIEETDIRDLDGAMARTDQADLDQVYARLQCGSRNHLRAFARLFQALTGQPYAAQVIDPATVDVILASGNERCGG